LEGGCGLELEENYSIRKSEIFPTWVMTVKPKMNNLFEAKRKGTYLSCNHNPISEVSLVIVYP